MVKKTEEASFKVGDKVMWRGILLTIDSIRKDGSIELSGGVMHMVHLSGFDTLKKVESVN